MKGRCQELEKTLDRDSGMLVLRDLVIAMNMTRVRTYGTIDIKNGETP